MAGDVIDTFSVRGQTYGVKYVRGKFYVDWPGGERIEATTLAELKKMVGAAQRKSTVAIDVPFDEWHDKNSTHRWDDNDETAPIDSFWRRGHVVGIHGANNNAIVRWDDKPAHAFAHERFSKKETEQYRDKYGGTITFAALTDELRGEWVRLKVAARTARAAVKTFEDEHKISLEAAGREAIGKATGVVPEESDE